MERPTLSATHAIQQAGMTVNDYVAYARKIVRDQIGTHVEISDANYLPFIAALVAAQVADFNNTSLTAALYELADAIRDAAERSPTPTP